MKISGLLIPLLTLATFAIADDDSTTKQQLEDVDASPFLDFFNSVLTVYVRDTFLEDRDVLEFAAEIEEALVNAEIDFNKIS